MWVCLNNSFLSIVANRHDPDLLLVRARIAGHIEAVFPGAKPYRKEGSDYEFRADILRTEVKAALARRVEDIDYDNFKGSVKDDELHDAYMGFWSIMFKLQDKLLRRKGVKSYKKHA